MRAYPRDVRVGAVADYLVGKKLPDIAARWGCSRAVVVEWVQAVGCFKLRNRTWRVDNRGVPRVGSSPTVYEGATCLKPTPKP